MSQAMNPGSSAKPQQSETSPLLGGASQTASWKPTKGDINCFFALFMNNLGTMIVTAIIGKGIFDRDGFKKLAVKPTEGFVDSIVFGTIIPGMVPTIVMGCVYYSWMAHRILKTKPAGTSMTALPYGINTPAALCFIFAIMAPTIEELEKTDVQKGLMSPDAAVKKAWHIGVIANFIAGVISMLFAFVGPALVKVTPPAALMIALAGVGFTWLGINPVLDCFSFGRCGMLTLVLGMLLQLNIIKTGKMPPAVVLLLGGTCVGWLSMTPWSNGGSLDDVSAAFAATKFSLPTIMGSDLVELVPEVLEKYLGVILPVAFTGAIGTLLNVSCAERTGDSYPLAETLFIDGLTTCISALFGSPYGTCVYIGHSQFKDMGGTISYPVIFSGAFTVLALGGAFGLISSLVPPYAIAPILVFIGLMIVTDAMSTAPVRHLPACVFGLFPAVAEYIVKSFGAPYLDPPKVLDDGSEVWPAHPWWGLQSLAQGSLLLCMLWTCIFVSIIDSRFSQATAWSLGGAAASAVGLIHQSKVDFQFENFFDATFPFKKGYVGTEPFSMTLGYGLLVVLFATLWIIQLKFPESGIVGMPYKDIEYETIEDEEVKRLSQLVEDNRNRSSFFGNRGSENENSSQMNDSIHKGCVAGV